MFCSCLGRAAGWGEDNRVKGPCDFSLAPLALITWLSWCLPGYSTVKSLFSPSPTLLFEAS